MTETDRDGRTRQFDWTFAYGDGTGSDDVNADDGGNGGGRGPNYREVDEAWLSPVTFGGVNGNPATQVLMPTDIISYGYNTAGELASIDDATSSVSYTYDSLGRLASTSESAERERR